MVRRFCCKKIICILISSLFAGSTEILLSPISVKLHAFGNTCSANGYAHTVNRNPQTQTHIAVSKRNCLEMFV